MRIAIINALGCVCFPSAPWSLQVIYGFIAVCVTIAFFVMYRTIPACQRSVVCFFFFHLILLILKALGQCESNLTEFVILT